MENNKDIIPIFYSDSSGRAINVWWPEKECKPDGPQSIITLAKKAGLKEIYFVSTRMYDFVSALKLCDDNNLRLVFGLELWVCSNPTEKSEASVADESKVIVWMRNSDGYKDIIKLYSKIFTNSLNKYYHFRASWDILNEMWTANLFLTIPFFDSFFHRNTLNYGSAIIPKFPVKLVFMREVNSGLPFAPLVDEALDNFIKDENYEVINTKTIYYADYEDAKAWIVFRSIKERSTFNKPQLDYCCSNNFCLSDYMEVIK